MAFNFPNAPNLGDQYQPVGGPVYTWDGQKWVMSGSPITWTPAYANRNRACNGAMQISQENGTTASATTASNVSYFMADEVNAGWALTGTATATRYVDANISPSGNNCRVQLNINTATASLTAAQYAIHQGRIEGVRIRDFLWGTAAAKRVIMRFSVMATAGTYTLFITNATQAQTYLANFTVTTTNVYQTFTFVIPGPTTGTWATDNTLGINWGIGLAAGTTYGGGSAGWQATSGWKFQMTGASNLAATAGNYFSFTDVGLYLDSQGSGIPPAWEMPDEAAELIACMRYWQQSRTLIMGNIQTGLSFSASGPVTVVPRTGSPSLTGVNVSNGAFPATVGTLNMGNNTVQESRTSNSTSAQGFFQSTVTINARM